MTSLRIGDIVWVPFPHVESNQIRPRPALIVSEPSLGPERSLAWAMMITNADRAPWPGDILIDDHESLGLPIPSKIRTEKIATLEVAHATFRSRLPEATLLRVTANLRRYLGATTR